MLNFCSQLFNFSAMCFCSSRACLADLEILVAILFLEHRVLFLLLAPIVGVLYFYYAAGCVIRCYELSDRHLSVNRCLRFSSTRAFCSSFNAALFYIPSQRDACFCFIHMLSACSAGSARALYQSTHDREL